MVEEESWRGGNKKEKRCIEAAPMRMRIASRGDMALSLRGARNVPRMASEWGEILCNE